MTLHSDKAQIPYTLTCCRLVKNVLHNILACQNIEDLW